MELSTAEDAPAALLRYFRGFGRNFHREGVE
jgi:hypothetical protein